MSQTGMELQIPLLYPDLAVLDMFCFFQLQVSFYLENESFIYWHYTFYLSEYFDLNFKKWVYDVNVPL